jgi:hypothetical protein
MAAQVQALTSVEPVQEALRGIAGQDQLEFLAQLAAQVRANATKSAPKW